MTKPNNQTWDTYYGKKFELHGFAIIPTNSDLHFDLNDNGRKKGKVAFNIDGDWLIFYYGDADDREEPIKPFVRALNSLPPSSDATNFDPPIKIFIKGRASEMEIIERETKSKKLLFSFFIDHDFINGLLINLDKNEENFIYIDKIRIKKDLVENKKSKIKIL